MIPLTAELLMGGLERKYAQPSRIDGDVIVVLGGGATSGTPDMDGEGNLSGAAANRLLTAARLYRRPDCLCSSPEVRYIPTAAMKRISPGASCSASGYRRRIY